MNSCIVNSKTRQEKGFTLIELLVVIAIIAILAAILFPVFAQAKVAAKKTASLTQMKQEGLSVMIYATDFDDNLPLTFFQDGDFSFPELFIPTPADVFEGDLPENVRAFSVVYPNSTHAYRKNSEILASPGISNWKNWWGSFPTQKPAWRNGFSINGLLNSYPTSAVNRPSQLPLFTQLLGDRNLDGMALNTPTLACQYTTPCRFTRTNSPNCQGEGPGTSSKVEAFPRQYDDSSSVWVYGKGQNWVSTDTSAKFRRLASHIDGLTDYRVDPFWDYSEKGAPGGYWMEEGQCFHLGFAPDFDFETWGTPYPGVWEVIQW